jgi:2-iminobutanoate/2-iminopropanoate deaminase
VPVQPTDEPHMLAASAGVHRTRARGVDVPGVLAPGAQFVHATIVPAGATLVFVSGQVPDDLDGSVPETFISQARLAWRNVERTLTAAGCTFDDIFKITMYIRDRRYRDDNRLVRNEVLGTRTPALTVIVADHWDDRWLIEIEVIATRPDPFDGTQP